MIEFLAGIAFAVGVWWAASYRYVWAQAQDGTVRYRPMKRFKDGSVAVKFYTNWRMVGGSVVRRVLE
jgi:hypothetical protein